VSTDQLRVDIVKVAQAARYAAATNKAATEDNKRSLEEQEERVRRVETWRAASEVRIEALETSIRALQQTDREHTGKFSVLEVTQAKGENHIAMEKQKTERGKYRWALYAAIGVAATKGIFDVVKALVEMIWRLMS
jgi:hypothetical protein